MTLPQGPNQRWSLGVELRMAPTAICSTSSPATAATSEPMPMAAASKTARGCRSKSPKPSSASGAPNASAIAYRRRAAYNSMSDSNPIGTFSYLAERLSGLGIVYLHVVDPVGDGDKRVSLLLRREIRRQLHRQWRLRSRQRRCGNPRPRGRSGRFRHAIPRQSRSAEAVPDQGAAQHA